MNKKQAINYLYSSGMSEDQVKGVVEALSQADGEITDDDIATMRILFNAEIGHFCNQGRHKDAEEMEQIRDRLMARLQADEDAISRQAVLEAIDVKAWEFCDYLISKNRNDEQKPVSHFADNLRECVREELPPVKPQQPCEDEYIKVPKKALKYRTAGMVAYNAEWLKNHFDIERVVICGAQEPCDDAISRQDAIKAIDEKAKRIKNEDTLNGLAGAVGILFDMPSVNPQEKTGHWIAQDIHNCHTEFKCSACGYIHNFMHLYGKPTADYTYCPNCGAKMVKLQESEDKE